MTVGVLVITHNTVGETLVSTAVKMLDVCPLAIKVLAVPFNPDVNKLTQEARKLAAELDSGDGVLVLTDLYGSTPSNIATSLLGTINLQVVAGINLPMLIRILNYPNLSLGELTQKALSGGSDGVLLCKQANGTD